MLQPSFRERLLSVHDHEPAGGRGALGGAARAVVLPPISVHPEEIHAVGEALPLLGGSPPDQLATSVELEARALSGERALAGIA